MPATKTTEIKPLSPHSKTHQIVRVLRMRFLFGEMELKVLSEFQNHFQNQNASNISMQLKNTIALRTPAVGSKHITISNKVIIVRRRINKPNRLKQFSTNAEIMGSQGCTSSTWWSLAPYSFSWVTGRSQFVYTLYKFIMLSTLDFST